MFSSYDDAQLYFLIMQIYLLVLNFIMFVSILTYKFMLDRRYICLFDFFPLCFHCTYSNKSVLPPPVCSGYHHRNTKFVLITWIWAPLLNHWCCNIYPIAGEKYASVFGHWLRMCYPHLPIAEICLKAIDPNNGKL